jgi:hypothetical protein
MAIRLCLTTVRDGCIPCRTRADGAWHRLRARGGGLLVREGGPRAEPGIPLTAAGGSLAGGAVRRAVHSIVANPKGRHGSG